MSKRPRSQLDEPDGVQQTVRPLQQLSVDRFPLHEVPLSKRTPYPEELETWRQRFHDNCLYNIRLIGDKQYPDDWVSIAAKDLVCHSKWGEALHNQQALHGNLVLPVCTPPQIVRKVVEALYTGYIKLSTGVEQILVIADALQVCQRKQNSLSPAVTSQADVQSDAD